MNEMDEWQEKALRFVRAKEEGQYVDAALVNPETVETNGLGHADNDYRWGIVVKVPSVVLQYVKTQAFHVHTGKGECDGHKFLVLALECGFWQQRIVLPLAGPAVRSFIADTKLKGPVFHLFAKDVTSGFELIGPICPLPELFDGVEIPDIESVPTLIDVSLQVIVDLLDESATEIRGAAKPAFMVVSCVILPEVRKFIEQLGIDATGG